MLTSPYQSPQHAETTRRQSLTRFVVLAWLCSAAIIAYIQRNSMGVAESTIREEWKSQGLNVDKPAMGWAMNSFLITYAVFQIPTGLVAYYLGSRKGLPIFTAVGSAVSSCLGLAGGLFGIYGVRLGMGTFQSGLFPCAATTITKWFPRMRVGLPNGLLSASMSIGGAIGTTLAGLLVPRIGWQATFAIFGLPGLVWAVGFWHWFRDRPEDHSAVSEEELETIREGRPPDPNENALVKKSEPIPWGTILSSASMWWVGAQQFFRAAGYMFFATWFATFLQETRNVSVQGSGLLNSLPLLGVVAGASIGGVLSDWILRASGSRWMARQGLSLVCLTGCAVLILASLAVKNTTLAVLVITAGSFCASLAAPCAYAITIDLGGRHVTAVFSFMNMCGNVGGFAFPILVPYLVKWTGSWSLVLYVFAGIYAAAAICWVCFDSRRAIVPDVEPAPTT
ncbi:MAG: MFS transporter [Planctomycetia bacterium]|nr:MFS transporter [Planctomycetia bacterium]